MGREFLESLNSLEGIPVEKVIDVCMEVAAGIVHEKAGRSVHELHEGAGGAAAVTRTSDNARAWRCSLQDNSPSARRLHWWSIPGAGGGAVEFACVVKHDDFSIPE